MLRVVQRSLNSYRKWKSKKTESMPSGCCKKRVIIKRWPEAYSSQAWTFCRCIRITEILSVINRSLNEISEFFRSSLFFSKRTRVIHCFCTAIINNPMLIKCNATMAKVLSYLRKKGVLYYIHYLSCVNNSIPSP